MTLILRNLRLSIHTDTGEIRALLARKLRIPADEIETFAVVRRSLDARRRDDIHFNCHVELRLRGGPALEKDVVRKRGRRDLERLRPFKRLEPAPGTEPLPHRPVIVGFGPAGMFAAWRLALHGYRPLVLERGRDVRRRHVDILQKFYKEKQFNPESNLLFGEGGAGAYSDGKLYTRVNDPLVRTILEAMVEHGAPPDILIDARPHIGSDRLPTVCRRMRKHIEQLGGEVRFDSRVEDFDIADGRLTGLRVNEQSMAVGPTTLCIGHSARDTIRRLAERGVTLAPKPFQLGVRIEHPQTVIDRWQYGSACADDHLPPAEYHLVAKGAALAGDLFSFCMCPGGLILPTNESSGLIATNGASRVNRAAPFGNAGLVVTMNSGQSQPDALAALDFLERLERRAFEIAGGDYRAPAQRAADLLAGRRSDGRAETSYPFGVSWSDMGEWMPAEVMQALANGLRMLHAKMPGFAGSEGLILAPESRVSAPLRIVRDPETRESISTAGLYPVGEGAGYAGGIVSAAIDGIRTADAIIRRYAPVG